MLEHPGRDTASFRGCDVEIVGQFPSECVLLLSRERIAAHTQYAIGFAVDITTLSFR